MDHMQVRCVRLCAISKCGHFPISFSGLNMSIENKSLESQALSAIHEEVLKLLKQSLPSEVEHRIQLIESICRHRHDVRTDAERNS